MDSFGDPASGTVPAEVSAAHRQEFNSAYSNLEQTIRNFSKEKLLLEQKIEDLQNELEMAKEAYQNMSLENEDAMAENKRLNQVYEENEKTRAQLSTLLSTVERKQDIILTTVDGFDQMEQSLAKRYEEHEEFIYCLKFRQVQLKQWMVEANKENDELRHAIQEMNSHFEAEKSSFEAEIDNRKIIEIKLKENLASLETSGRSIAEKLETATMAIHKQASDFEEEKSSMQNDFAAKLKTEIDDLTRRFEDEKLVLQNIIEQRDIAEGELKDQLIKSEDNAKSLSEQLAQQKTDAENQASNFEKVKANLTQTFETSLEKEREALTNQFEKEKETISNHFEAEKKSLIDGFDRERETLTSNFEKEKETMTNNFVKEKEALNMDFEKEKLTLAHRFEEEKGNLTNDFEKAKTALECTIHELINAEGKLKEQLATLEAESKSLTEKLDAAKADAEKQTLVFDEEKKAMNAGFEEECQKYEDEREELEKTHQLALDKLNDELEKTKRERRDLLKRYQDQKQAISKMVEEVGVRPVILPRQTSNKVRTPTPVGAPTTEENSSKPDNMRQAPKTPMAKPPQFQQPSTPISSQDRLKQDAVRQTPKTPVAKQIPIQDPTTPTRTGILKRSSFSAGDKVSRNVSFGSTIVKSFSMSGSDTDDSSTGESIKEASRKRMKLHDDPKETDSDESNLKEDDAKENDMEMEKKPPAKPPRRYLRRGISQQKKSMA